MINLVGSGLALILGAHIVFLLLHANRANAVVRWVAHTADIVGLWFVGLVNTGDAAFSAVLDYALAAVFWLVVTGAVARLLRSVG